MKKKFLALVLTLAMAFSLLSATALAVETNDGTDGGTPTVTVPDGKVKLNETVYNSVFEAVQAAAETEMNTIYLGKGTYTLYGTVSGNASTNHYTSGKCFTFIGAGRNETTWMIGAPVPDPEKLGTEYNADYSFGGCTKVVFQNMTLSSYYEKENDTKGKDSNYLGFAHTIDTEVVDCTINGLTFYWGYTSATFRNTTFNCPDGDYAIWTYSSATMTFDHCTFNSSGKVINVYNENNEADYTINFNNCTVNSSNSDSLSVMNINDSLVKKFTINFTGTNKVTGIKADGIHSTDGSRASPAKDTVTNTMVIKTSEQATCSKLFEFNMKYGNGNTGKTTVNIDGKTVWKDGKMVSHAIDTAHDKYTDGYKDNAFTTTYGSWAWDQDEHKLVRTVTKTCQYCSRKVTSTEYKDLELDVSRSKTAKELDSNRKSTVTLSLPSAEEELASDVVFVLDTSDCVGAVMDQVSGLVTQLKAARQSSGANIKVGVVAFKGSALPMFDGKLVSVEDAEKTLTKMIGEIKAVPQQNGKPDKAAQEQVVMKYINKNDDFIYKGSNLHSGLLGAQELLKKDTAVSNTRKYVVTVTDGMTYYWNKGDDVYGVYGGSNADNTAEANLLFYTWCGVHGIDTEGTYKFPETFSWDNYVTNAKALIADDKGAYDVNIRDAAAKLNKDFNAVRSIANNDLTAQNIPYISYNDRAKHAHGIDQSVITCLATYQEMVDSKYKCYVVNSDYDTSTFPGLFTSELNKLANVTGNVDFTSIKNDILYAVGAGSVVEDKMGADFDFVPGSLKLTVNGKALDSKVDGDTTYFGAKNATEEIGSGNYRFKVEYDSANDKFTWTINENVSNFAPVQLSYQVKLVNANTAAGTYKVLTNEYAKLTPQNSAGQVGKELTFNNPEVSYTVSGGGSGGSHKPTVTIPDDVPTGLNGKDHYAYVVGYPDGMVYPQKNITRAEVATIFFRLLEDETREANMTKSNSYNDMKDGAWYTCAVSTLSKMGIIKGYEDGSFKPDASISRAEFAAIAARFDPDGDKTPATFSDVSSHWAKDEISIAANHGWIKGYEDGSFKPDQKITRAETMTLVNRVLKRLPETKDDLHKDMKTWPDNQNESAWFYLAVQEATNSHYQKLKKDGIHETWESMRETRDWAALEK